MLIQRWLLRKSRMQGTRPFITCRGWSQPQTTCCQTSLLCWSACRSIESENERPFTMRAFYYVTNPTVHQSGGLARTGVPLVQTDCGVTMEPERITAFAAPGIRRRELNELLEEFITKFG